jgi:ankyrin repeat protein
VVKLLLETGKVDVETKDSHGQTPLSLATWSGHKAVVKLLLETGKVDVETRDSHGQTPPSWAT